MKLSRLYPVLLGAIIGLACVRIISTYEEFWQTWDESAHIACGVQWWEKGQYSYERFHPPLARIFLGAGPYFAGVRGLTGAKDHWTDGNAILHYGGLYERNLALARIGVIPFFVLASLIVAAWGRRFGDEATSLCSVFLFGLLPPVLAHSGLATLDVACASLVVASLYALSLLMAKPCAWRAVVFGAVSGLAFSTKFSSGVFIAAGGLGILLAGRITASSGQKKVGAHGNPRPRSICLASVVLLAASFAVWAAYRFSFYPLIRANDGPGEIFSQIVAQSGPFAPWVAVLATKVPLPALDFFWGLFDLFYFRRGEGHSVYFLGEIGKQGWWLFYPVVFLLKTPPAFLLLAGFGCISVFAGVRAARSGAFFPLSLALAVAAVFISAVFATPHNGLRQILAVYPLLSVAAGSGVVLLWRSARSQIAGKSLALVLVFWCTASSFAAHPDYLAYFNFLAGSKPGEIVNDSDLDWGQDLKRLSEACRRHNIGFLHLAYNGSRGMDLAQFPLPPLAQLQPRDRPYGWVAVSERMLYLGNGEPPYDQFSWLRGEKPVQRVGDSILLYRFE